MSPEEARLTDPKTQPPQPRSVSDRSVPATVRAARAGTAVIFLLVGTGMGLWVVHIPVVQRHLGLSDGVLGIALFAIVGGAIAAMPLAGWAATRRGSRFATRLMAVLFAIGVGLPLLATDLLTLMVGGFVLGFGMGGADISMNAQAVTVERLYGRPIMSSLHAFYSLGGLIGAVAGAGLLAMPWDGSLNMLAAAVVLLVAGLVAGRSLVPEDAGPKPGEAKLTLGSILRPRLLAIGALSFFAFFSEGAVGDWSSLFLSRHTGATPALAALGFAAFSVTMTLARFMGDRVVVILGPRRSLAAGGLLASAGMLLAILVPSLPVGVIGFALMGFGFANIVPILFSAAGRAGATPGAGIALVTMIAYGGLLIGPPLIGGLAEIVGLTAALGVVALFGLLVALGTRAVPG